MSFLSQGEYTYVRDFVESNRHLDGLSARQLREANVDQLLWVERAVEVPINVVLNIVWGSGLNLLSLPAFAYWFGKEDTSGVDSLPDVGKINSSRDLFDENRCQPELS